ncbi:hypothetical protein B0T14DRAFT_256993 [Immersiella caudata]|uniref:Uncharacterized protein n=1 Tax=Immersiella caudata TaxID=314043 RepID=A0AA39WKH4_9PEZI|nr:hypothetical protein B0T14DRAFT_256993 [Immersiella caudata]
MGCVLISSVLLPALKLIGKIITLSGRMKKIIGLSSGGFLSQSLSTGLSDLGAVVTRVRVRFGSSAGRAWTAPFGWLLARRNSQARAYRS